ncbi:MAG: hypothetical protein ABSE48_06370 [Verrucomicrobiota bacterium]|jgi:hypothetical protein
MKTKMKTIMMLLAVSATAIVAGAQDDGTNAPSPDGPDQGGPGSGPRRHHRPIPAIVLALDVNHDGIIDSNEIANASAELLTLDKNGDGRLTRDEYLGRPPGPPPDANGDNEGGPPDGGPGGPPDGATNQPPQGGPDQGGPGFGPGRHHPPIPAIVRALDVNHDGIIDSNEIANASAELFTLDKNGDGRLTRDEYMGKRPGPPPPDSDDGNDGPPDGGLDGPPPMQ